MARGGKREGAGRRKLKPENHGAPKKNEAREIIDSLGKPNGHKRNCTCWKCLWKRDGERSDSIGLHARKYLWDREGGKPVDTVNHVHDKPIELNATLTLGEGMRRAMEKAEERVRSGKY